MTTHLIKRFPFPVTIAHLPQVQNFLNRFLETFGQECCCLARADQGTGENMGDPKRCKDFGSQACLFLPASIEGYRTLARDPATHVRIRLPVSYQYHQRHAASFPRLCRRRGHRPLRRHCVGAGAKSPFLSVLREARQYSLVENRYMIPYHSADSALTLSRLLYTMRVTLQRR